MELIINNIVDLVIKNKIKIITISESNHRSYTSHTFHFELFKKLYERNLINTFSSERLGIIDADIINWYLENKKISKSIIKKLPFGGLGSYRIIEYLNKQNRNDYKLYGSEEDNYCVEAFRNLPKKFDLISENFLNQLKNNVKIKDLMPETENDLRWYESLKSFEEDNRENFWLEHIKKILKERNNLFINGYHLGKNDKIGKWLLKNYSKSEILFLGMGTKHVKTQLLIMNSKIKNFNKAVLSKNYIQKVINVDEICPPTELENELEKNEWKMIKVDHNNKNKKIRSIGCYLAIYEKDYLAKNKVSVSYEIKKYDYVILFENNVYKNKMFF